MSFAIPVKRLRETDTLLAFYHPKPSYPVHILLVPKRAIGSLMELSSNDMDFYADLVQTVQSLVAEFDLEARGYRLVVNGGEYQEVGHHAYFADKDFPADFMDGYCQVRLFR